VDGGDNIKRWRALGNIMNAARGADSRASGVGMGLISLHHKNSTL